MLRGYLKLAKNIPVDPALKISHWTSVKTLIDTQDYI